MTQVVTNLIWNWMEKSRKKTEQKNKRRTHRINWYREQFIMNCVACASLLFFLKWNEMKRESEKEFRKCFHALMPTHPLIHLPGFNGYTQYKYSNHFVMFWIFTTHTHIRALSRRNLMYLLVYVCVCLNFGHVMKMNYRTNTHTQCSFNTHLIWSSAMPPNFDFCKEKPSVFMLIFCIFAQYIFINVLCFYAFVCLFFGFGLWNAEHIDCAPSHLACVANTML